MSLHRYVLLLPALIEETTVDETKREHPFRIECVVFAEDASDAARVVRDALHVALVRGSYSPAEDGLRADLLALPVREATADQRAAFSVLQAPRRLSAVSKGGR